MENEVANHVNEAPAAAQPGGSLSGCLVWFLGGITLSFSVVLSLVLLVLLTGSVALNVYLGWQLAGLEVTVSRIATETPAVVVVTATPALAAQPDAKTAPAADVAAAPQPQLLTATPVVVTATPLPPGAQLQSQQATVAAIATQSSQSGEAAAFVLPTTTVSGAVAMDPAGSDAPADDGSGGVIGASGGEPPPPAHRRV